MDGQTSERAVVLASGGLDSTVAAAVARRQERLRVRLLLHRDGRVELTAAVLPDEPPSAELPKVIFSQERVDPADPHRFHKTTRRELYDRERGKAVAQGFHEVLFVNTAGQVTEGSISNLFVRLEKDGPLFTPPVSSGLLAGTYRRMLLEQSEAAERELTVEDVLAASEMYLGNSVRGLVRAQLA